MINHSLGSLIKTEPDNNLQHGLVMKYVSARYENHTTFYDSLEDRTYVVIMIHAWKIYLICPQI